jgi:hypothetical protein
VGLSLGREHRRGHDALYDGINHGRVETYGRGKDQHLMFPAGRTRSSQRWKPGVPRGPHCWTRPGADVAAVTTTQIRDVVERLINANQWRHGDPEILVVLDAG